MKITFVTPHAGLSGGIRVVAIYAERLRRRGHEVLVVSTPPWRPGLFESVRLLMKGRLPRRPDGRSPYLDGTGVPHRVLDIVRPVRDADLPDADVVVATWWETASWVASLSPEKGSKVYFMQDYGAPGQDLYKIAPTWSKGFYIITIAEWLRKLIEIFSPDLDVQVVHNSVDIEKFQTKSRKKNSITTVGFLYRSMPSKGAATAIEATLIAKKHIPELKVKVFGDYVSYKLVEKTFPYFFQYHACPSDNEAIDIYSSCDAWIFPSTLEGFGLPLLEAMACRTPVIATRAGAAPELVRHGENGYLLDLGDASGMADSIRSIHAMSIQRWRAMSDAAYATATSYSWDDATDRFEACLAAAAGLETTVRRMVEAE